MPTQPRDPATVPAIQTPPAFSANHETEEGAIRGLLEALHSTVVNMVQRMNGLLSLGTPAKAASWTGNLDGQWLSNVVFDGAVTVAIPHGLGRLPAGIIPVIRQFIPDDASTAPLLLASPTDSWTQDVVYLTKENAGRHTVSLLVF